MHNVKWKVNIGWGGNDHGSYKENEKGVCTIERDHNWIRTEYNNNGGGVPYLTEKGYSASISSSSSVTEGSIMYYNNKSHVALVTLIDGSTIKYSQYSNVTKTAIYYVYNSKADDVTFYVPQ